MAKARRLSRTDSAQRALAACAELALPDSCDVAVVGGGAAGLTSAIVAAEAGARVVVIEASPECGRTILATGGGRCNFANANLNPSAYNNPTFAHAVMGEEALDAILSFFHASGLTWTQEQGRFYPASMQAASVRDVLLARASRSGAVLACGRKAIDIKDVADGFSIHLSELFEPQREIHLHCSNVIVACGGTCEGLPSRLGLPWRERRPGLCALMASGAPLALLDGRRARVRAALIRNGSELACEEGELLFRSWGVSGIVIFDLSRTALPDDKLVIDLAPSLDKPSFDALISSAGNAHGIMDPVIADALEHAFGSVPKTIELHIEGPSFHVPAQVTLGGLETDAFNPSTLMAKDCPGLFACGEALDIDARCGGYNLAFAWMSGMVAGNAAASCSEVAHA